MKFLKTLGMKGLCWFGKACEKIRSCVVVVGQKLKEALQHLLGTPGQPETINKGKQPHLSCRVPVVDKAMKFIVQKLKLPTALVNIRVWFDKVISSCARFYQVFQLINSRFLIGQPYLKAASLVAFQFYRHGGPLNMLKEVIPPETWAHKEDYAQVALAWVNLVLPPEKRDEKIKLLLKAKPYAVAAIVAVEAVMYFVGRGGGAVKMMKAPGRNYKIPRATFESNPSKYFAGLRVTK